MGRGVRFVAGLLGLLALAQGLALFLAPGRMSRMWPWALTPLTSQVMGAIMCLGSAYLGVLVDARWASIRLLVQVQAVMLVLILAAAVRARSEFYPSRPLTWVLLTGILGVFVGSLSLWWTMEAHRSSE